ncbi:CBS domain-containing protein [Pseudooceanicola sp. C21-150M6]|uniref:CBS domain-containing protein n=1 Tax=Pseudooceanicola sp. C21-150M6 TaxID=3434355 RepID=UPI003D7F8B2E
MIVQQILKAKGAEGVVTATPDMSVTDVAGLLTQNRIGGVVVSASGDTADGILSERDIVRALSTRGPSILNDRADALMTKSPVCCTRADTADEVLRRMTDGRFRHMPVVEDGVLIGIVTIGDVVKARLSQLSMERDALEGMVAGH